MATIAPERDQDRPFLPMPGRVVGIDPGLNVTGYAVVEPGRSGPRVVEAGVIRAGRDAAAMGKRLETIHQGIEATPEAFLGLFQGENMGKMLVKL